MRLIKNKLTKTIYKPKNYTFFFYIAIKCFCLLIGVRSNRRASPHWQDVENKRGGKKGKKKKKKQFSF